MRGGTHRCGQQNGPTEVDPMVDDWDGWISTSIKVKLKLETKGIPKGRIGNSQPSMAWVGLVGIVQGKL